MTEKHRFGLEAVLLLCVRTGLEGKIKYIGLATILGRFA